MSPKIAANGIVSRQSRREQAITGEKTQPGSISSRLKLPMVLI
jgi:hypothetical protein